MPLCFELHRAAFDPRWAVITEQLEETIIAPNDQVLAAVTAQAAVIIDWLTGRPFPPGAPHKRFYAGELFDIDIYGKSQHQLVGARTVPCISKPKCALKKSLLRLHRRIVPSWPGQRRR